MNTRDNNTLWLICDCQSEGLYIEKDEESNLFNFSIWIRGVEPQSYPWRVRWRLVWRILTGKPPYTDEIILNFEKIIDLCEFLKYHINKSVLSKSE